MPSAGRVGQRRQQLPSHIRIGIVHERPFDDRASADRVADLAQPSTEIDSELRELRVLVEGGEPECQRGGQAATPNIKDTQISIDNRPFGV